MLRGFYAIVDVSADEARHNGVSLADLAVKKARPLLRAQPCMLQLRVKSGAAGEMVAAGLALRPLCQAAAVPLCINDRLDVALAVEADAVHLGQDDLPIEVAQQVLRKLGRKMRVGVSTHGLAQARAAAAQGADYLGFGPIYATATKSNPDPVVGTAQLAQVVAEVSLAIVAIGGITLATIDDVAATGVAAAAVIGAVQSAPDPEAAARRVQRAFATVARTDV